MNWLPDRALTPVIDNWPPKPLSIYADFDYEAVMTDDIDPTPPNPADLPDDSEGIPVNPDPEEEGPGESGRPDTGPEPVDDTP